MPDLLSFSAPNSQSTGNDKGNASANVADGTGPYTSSEKQWLNENRVGCEYKMFQSHGLNIYEEEDPEKGRAITRERFFFVEEMTWRMLMLTSVIVRMHSPEGDPMGARCVCWIQDTHLGLVRSLVIWYLVLRVVELLTWLIIIFYLD